MRRILWQLEAPWLQRTPSQPEAALGAATWLWMHDLKRRKQTLQEMEHRLLAPLQAGQYVVAREARTFSGPSHPPPPPIALLLFARFDEGAQARYLAAPSQRIASRDWHSGERLWLIDWTAPFGHTPLLRAPLMALLAGHDARSLCRSRQGSNDRVRLWQRLPLSPLPPPTRAETVPCVTELAWR